MAGLADSFCLFLVNKLDKFGSCCRLCTFHRLHLVRWFCCFCKCPQCEYLLSLAVWQHQERFILKISFHGFGIFDKFYRLGCKIWLMALANLTVLPDLLVWIGLAVSDIVAYGFGRFLLDMLYHGYLLDE